MLSSLFARGGSFIFATMGTGLLLGGLAGTYAVYQHDKHSFSSVKYWQQFWKQYRLSYPDNDDNDNDEYNNRALKDEYLNLLLPSIPKISSPSQVKSIRIFIPLCGASKDLEILNNFIIKKVKNKVLNEEIAKQYKIKIIGLDSSDDAIKLFLDKLDIREKNINPFSDDFSYKNEYVLTSDNKYKIDQDIFSKINIFKHQNYNLINCDIFDASTPRLILRADAIYDNNALAILHPSERDDYIHHIIKNIITKKTKILLATERFDINERDESQQNSLPYSFNNKQEIFECFKPVIKMNQNNITLLESFNWNKEKLEKFGFPENSNNAHTDIWLIQCEL